MELRSVSILIYFGSVNLAGVAISVSTVGFSVHAGSGTMCFYYCFSARLVSALSMWRLAWRTFLPPKE